MKNIGFEIGKIVPALAILVSIVTLVSPDLLENIGIVGFAQVKVLAVCGLLSYGLKTVIDYINSNRLGWVNVAALVSNILAYTTGDFLSNFDLTESQEKRTIAYINLLIAVLGITAKTISANSSITSNLNTKSNENQQI